MLSDQANHTLLSFTSKDLRFCLKRGLDAIDLCSLIHKHLISNQIASRHNLSALLQQRLDLINQTALIHWIVYRTVVPDNTMQIAADVVLASQISKTAMFFSINTSTFYIQFNFIPLDKNIYILMHRIYSF